MEEIIRINQLTIGYDKQRPVFTGMTAALHPRRLTCLLGPNGMGKSTLLRTMAGFLRPLSGQLLFHDTPIQQLTAQQLSKIVSVVLTDKVDVQNLTVWELVALGRSPYTGFWGRLSDDDRQVVEQALSRTGISHLADRMTHTLSDGERQKVMIAKAMAQQTPFILLDEPTAFLDYPSKVELMEMLSRLATEEGKAIFLSTHDVELALRMADEIWLMTPDGLVVDTPSSSSIQSKLFQFLKYGKG